MKQTNRKEIKLAPHQPPPLGGNPPPSLLGPSGKVEPPPSLLEQAVKSIDQFHLPLPPPLTKYQSRPKEK